MCKSASGKTIQTRRVKNRNVASCQTSTDRRTRLTYAVRSVAVQRTAFLFFTFFVSFFYHYFIYYYSSGIRGVHLKLRIEVKPQRARASERRKHHDLSTCVFSGSLVLHAMSASISLQQIAPHQRAIQLPRLELTGAILIVRCAVVHSRRAKNSR